MSLCAARYKLNCEPALNKPALRPASNSGRHSIEPVLPASITTPTKIMHTLSTVRQAN
ncbi:Uncharacterised protein [Vibrio cholerae]|nr:Uncharacterised protein [Vibrio cholerae]